MDRRFSLTNRLTLFFAISSTITVIGMGWLLMYATEQHFLEIDRAALVDKKKLIENILLHTDSLTDSRLKLMDSLGNHHNFFALVKTQQGEILFQTEGFSPNQNFIVDDSRKTNQDNAIVDFGQSQLITLNFQTIKAKGQFEVTVALDTMHHQHFLIGLRQKLILYAIVAVFACGLLGWIAAYRGMAPLRAMKKRAAGVSPHQLQARMPIESLPAEMADFSYELNRMLDRLQDGFDRLLAFSADLAHELRTPITNLLTQTQVTLSASRSVAVYQDNLASNAEELQRLARMVSDMLFLAKTERGIDLPTNEHFAVKPAIEAVFSFYEAISEEKQIFPVLIGDSTISGDRLMFRRAITNLMSNALRHTPAGGQIVVEVIDTPRSIIIAVENSGDQIAPDVLQRIFDRFYRADSSRSQPTSDGAGLGLSIVQAIMQAHGGKVLADSGAGKNCFKLIFQRHKQNKKGYSDQQSLDVKLR